MAVNLLIAFISSRNELSCELHFLYSNQMYLFLYLSNTNNLNKNNYA